MIRAVLSVHEKSKAVICILTWQYECYQCQTCLMVVLALSLFIPQLVIVTTFQDHSGIKHFKMKVVFLSRL